MAGGGKAVRCGAAWQGEGRRRAGDGGDSDERGIGRWSARLIAHGWRGRAGAWLKPSGTPCGRAGASEVCAAQAAVKARAAAGQRSVGTAALLGISPSSWRADPASSGRGEKGTGPMVNSEFSQRGYVGRSNRGRGYENRGGHKANITLEENPSGTTLDNVANFAHSTSVYKN
ncbi:hypothetical protein E2562_030774 [Oryza meyeriana var. granulata]|uniref:Uncharacterized protein n=1 Tax=Oryza meyeriana var. granulata TaxID=110450 RepID=A0A6G1C8D2_9ORYZ|nr:hypothetical protein E2562_030774 [Oryza meyeriana var. granulata]